MKKSLKKLNIGLFAAALISLTGCATQSNTTATSSSAPVFSQAQQQAISSIVAQTMIQNPTILLQSIQALKAQQQKTINQETSIGVQQSANEFLNDPYTPTIGPKSASVVVVEFFDYQCPYCHQVFPGIENLIASNPNVRFEFKELPFVGEPSRYAAEVSLLAYQQGKFADFHNTLFGKRIMEGQLTDRAVDLVAEQVGVNLGKNKVLLQQAFIQHELADTSSLAAKLQINGTPGFVVMPNTATPDLAKISFIPGAVPNQTLIQAIGLAGSS